MAKGLESCLSDTPVWPPGAAEFRNMCLGVSTDSKGKEIAHRAGIYDTGPTEHMKTKKKLLLESDRVKQERKQKGIDALDNLRGLLDG